MVGALVTVLKGLKKSRETRNRCKTRDNPDHIIVKNTEKSPVALRRLAVT